MAPGQDGNSATKERVPRDALFSFALPVRAGFRVGPPAAALEADRPQALKGSTAAPFPFGPGSPGFVCPRPWHSSRATAKIPSLSPLYQPLTTQEVLVAMNIKPLYDRVVIKRMEEEKMSAGGIVIP